MPLSDTTGWVPRSAVEYIPNEPTPPQYILDALGGSYDTTKYRWDPATMSLWDRTAGGGSYYYGDIADPSLGTDVVTNLSNYNRDGRTADGTFHFDEGVNPYIAFPGESYNAGLTPNSGLFLSADPNEIADYRSGARDRVQNGIGQVGALVGGMALGGALSGGGTTTGTRTAVVSGSNTAAGVDLGSMISSGMGPQAAVGTGSGGFLANNLPAILSGASTLIGGVMASNRADDAVDAMTESNREALDYQRESRDTALRLLEPERQAANAATARMLQMQGLPIPAALQADLDASGVALDDFDVTDTPGYQFRLDESMRALEAGAFARGGGMSGGFARSALRYAQDYASSEYDKIYQQLSTLAGRSTAVSGGNVALNFGGNAASIAQDTGAARASGYVAQSNAWQNALDQVAQLPWEQWFPGRNRQATAGA